MPLWCPSDLEQGRGGRVGKIGGGSGLRGSSGRRLDNWWAEGSGSLVRRWAPELLGLDDFWMPPAHPASVSPYGLTLRERWGENVWEREDGPETKCHKHKQTTTLHGRFGRGKNERGKRNTNQRVNGKKTTRISNNEPRSR